MNAAALENGIVRLPGWLVLGLWTLAVGLPLYILIISCFKTTGEIYGDKFGLPTAWTLANFVKAWTQADFTRYMANSFIVTVSRTIEGSCVRLSRMNACSPRKVWPSA